MFSMRTELGTKLLFHSCQECSSKYFVSKLYPWKKCFIVFYSLEKHFVTTFKISFFIIFISFRVHVCSICKKSKCNNYRQILTWIISLDAVKSGGSRVISGRILPTHRIEKTICHRHSHSTPPPS